MKCEEFIERISEYVDEDVEPSERQRIEAHLEKCERCRHELDAMKSIAEAAQALPRRQPSTETVLKISGAIHQKAQTPRRTDFGPIMDVNELAEFLRIDIETIDEYLNEIPCFELGGKLLFRKKSIEEWIETREKSFGYQMRTYSEENVFIHRNINRGGAEWKTQRSN